jgi:alpha-methylacyl-CoA racemase
VSLPLEGIRVVELASQGPGPFAGMHLADLGADVVRVVRPDASGADLVGDHHLLRSRTIVRADLRRSAEVAKVLELVGLADVFVEGFRPGVAERLGLGPDECHRRNPGLVYARVTGWGQDGPRARSAGHDINYLAVSGALATIGPRERPVPPLSLVGNYGGGGAYLVIGVLAALLRRQRTGLGEVLDVATVDGACSLLQPILDLQARGSWSDERESNLLDGGAPFYRVYECQDGRFMAVGAIEPGFYRQFVAGLGLDVDALPDQHDRNGWPALRERFAAAFRQQPSAHWVAVYDGRDACVTPVLTMAEAADDPQLRHRHTLVRDGAGLVAAAAPRFAGFGSAEGRNWESATAELDAVVESWAS